MVAHQTSADIVAPFSGFKNGSKALLQLHSAGLCTTFVAEEMGDILIPSLMVGDCSHSLCVRVSRLWEFLDPQDDSRLLHTDLVLLDEETTPHQGDNLLLGKEIIPAPPNVQTPSGAHNTPGANTLRLLPLKLANSQDDAYSVLDGSTNKTDKSVTGKRSRTSPSKKTAKKLFRDEVITDDDAAGSTDVDAE
ncbi:hypothetical protein Zm00014a_021911 [Zea mays]|uniref:Uncharacterized protein n=1 Tax=Zea mays TaxID=4577 RepID=A0A3L6EPF8_MAIZE|nr:hypothetical protein Zm00014a_021911 [Zea mays]